MRTVKPNRPTKRRSALEKLLDGPVPPPRLRWRFFTVLSETFPACEPPWPVVKHRRNGVKVWYGGKATWSECHHVYRFTAPQAIQRAARGDVTAMLLALADALELHPVEIHAETLWMQLRKSPDGLCRWCFALGRRRRGQVCTVSRPASRWEFARCNLDELCEEHASLVSAEGAEVQRV